MIVLCEGTAAMPSPGLHLSFSIVVICLKLPSHLIACQGPLTSQPPLTTL